jgi:hypothetical protein
MAMQCRHCICFFAISIYLFLSDQHFEPSMATHATYSVALEHIQESLSSGLTGYAFSNSQAAPNRRQAYRLYPFLALVKIFRHVLVGVKPDCSKTLRCAWPHAKTLAAICHPFL